MNAKQAYLAWLREAAPAVYAVAVQKVARQKRSLGGLNRNLVTSMYAPTTGFGFLSDTTGASPTDLSTVDTSSFITPDLSSLDATSATIDSSGGSSGGSSWFDSGTFSSLLNAATNVADTVITSNAQSKLVQLNSQRAAQGLWPIQTNGQPVPPSQLYPSASPSIARFESAISTGGMTTPLLLIAGVGLLAFALLKRS